MPLTHRQILKHRRFIGLMMVLVLLANIATSAVLANVGGSDQFAWMCTSQGLVKITLTDESLDVPDMASVNHCPYCQLFDLSFDLDQPDLSYPQPAQPKASVYQNPTSAFRSQALLRFRPQRAPPLLSRI